MRKSSNLRIAVSLFGMGLVGIASLLSVSPPSLSPGLEMDPATVRWITLVNPIILLIISITIGTLLKEAAGVKLPILDSKQGEPLVAVFQSLIQPFLVLTTVSALGVLLIYLCTYRGFGSAYREVINGPGLPFWTRILYGGITEEILMRYGVMTVLLWILKEINRPNSHVQFWISNFLTAMLFATGHLPAIFNEVPSPSIWTLIYILGGNFWAGLCFGYAFWRYGLILAILTHMGFHLITYFII
ncbi:CPBP family intramembrane glutamic endopeptidase [Aquiflexum gelatinilyticum]|uniref:CPBP family intramembrane metalloprotease n=1 Tax=Aquiflexum gelatinilyticum TaxID=2961943 RepID=A0A9X2T1A9_9BACT|nr:CPBP family intramembrane glutamic endopeptidase [Aquiflexum gelatinilyticum]MCR9015711.1 CPBP family intramembrane metalloprotease [Aquiflexum gelatinilyticum]MCS4436172.1 CPBP family intramembrane metalloprotease [Aquiflexum gelatinilyticum]